MRRATCSFSRPAFAARALVLACALGLACGAWARGGVLLAGVRLPSSVRLDGTALVAVSCGVRDTLWVDHYAAVLYVPRGSVPAAARDPARSFAIVLRMIETRYMPEHVPDKWLAALERTVPPRPLAQIRRAYRRLADGDRVRIDYTPARGVAMRVNGRTVARIPGHRAIDAILDAWAEGEDVDAKLARLHVEHPC